MYWTPELRPKFPNTYCSQCGQEFGPGDHGFSMCRGHRTSNLENLKIAYERVGTIADCEFDQMRTADARFIEAAHDLMPRLLEAVETLEAIVAATEQVDPFLSNFGEFERARHLLENLK